jgi:hypothetical protein
MKVVGVEMDLKLKISSEKIQCALAGTSCQQLVSRDSDCDLSMSVFELQFICHKLPVTTVLSESVV